MNATMKAIRNIFAAILLIICLCISMVRCTDNQATTGTTGESIMVQNPSSTTDTQIPEETEAVTTPNIEETVPLATETVTTEPNHVNKYTSKITNPSCTESGYTTFICDCGETYTADHTKATGHNCSKKIAAPSCTKKSNT